MATQHLKKRVLFIENDLVITSGFQSFVTAELSQRSNGFEMEIIVARHMAAATALLRAEHFDALIVDLMLPPDDLKLSKIESLEPEQASLQEKLAGDTDYDSDELNDGTARLWRELDDLDEEIEECLNLEGGCVVLEEFSREVASQGKLSKPEPLALPVLFLTARGPREVQARCRRIVARRYFRWFDKPTKESELFRTLMQLLVQVEG